MAAGQGRILDALEKFHLDDNDLKFLADRKVVSPETIKWLENFHFSGSIKGYREGEMFFPNSPILQVEGTFGECTLLETLLLSILNYDSAVASAASRMVSAAKDRPCMDMGGRRTNEWAAVAAARAAVVGGFKGTANLLAAQMYGLKAIGTAAHCFTLVHDDERSAFESQIAALGKNTTLLVDTYNIEEAVKTAVDVAGPRTGRRAHRFRRPRVPRAARTQPAGRARRHQHEDHRHQRPRRIRAGRTADRTGRLLRRGHHARHRLRRPDLRDGLQAHRTRELRRRNAAGRQEDRRTRPPFRAASSPSAPYEYSLADCEHVISGSEDKLAAYQPEDGWKDLLVDYVTNGENHSEYQGHDAIVNAHNYRAQALAELPIGAQSLMKGDPVIPTEVTVL